MLCQHSAWLVRQRHHDGAAASGPGLVVDGAGVSRGLRARPGLRARRQAAAQAHLCLRHPDPRAAGRAGKCRQGDEPIAPT